MSSRNERVVIKSFTQMRKRDRRRRLKAMWALTLEWSMTPHPALVRMFREERLASHLVTKTTWGVRL